MISGFNHVDIGEVTLTGNNASTPLSDEISAKLDSFVENHKPLFITGTCVLSFAGNSTIVAIGIASLSIDKANSIISYFCTIGASTIIIRKDKNAEHWNVSISIAQ